MVFGIAVAMGAGDKGLYQLMMGDHDGSAAFDRVMSKRNEWSMRS